MCSQTSERSRGTLFEKSYDRYNPGSFSDSESSSIILSSLKESDTGRLDANIVLVFFWILVLEAQMYLNKKHKEALLYWKTVRSNVFIRLVGRLSKERAMIVYQDLTPLLHTLLMIRINQKLWYAMKIILRKQKLMLMSFSIPACLQEGFEVWRACHYSLWALHFENWATFVY